MASGAFTDTAGNNNTAATQFNWTYDGTAPTMTITAAEVNDGDTSNDATLSLTFTASEATNNFVVGDITVSGGTLSNFAATSSTFTQQPLLQQPLEQQQLMWQVVLSQMLQVTIIQLLLNLIGRMMELPLHSAQSA